MHTGRILIRANISRFYEKINRQVNKISHKGLKKKLKKKKKAKKKRKEKKSSKNKIKTEKAIPVLNFSQTKSLPSPTFFPTFWHHHCNSIPKLIPLHPQHHTSYQTKTPQSKQNIKKSNLFSPALDSKNEIQPHPERSQVQQTKRNRIEYPT